MQSTRQATQPCFSARTPVCTLLVSRSPALWPRRTTQPTWVAQLGVAGCLLADRSSTQQRRGKRSVLLRRSAFGDHGHAGGSNSNPKDLDDYIEVKVDSVRVSSGASVVFLRLVGNPGLVLPVHIGEAESSALLKEINKQKGIRPLTHDCARNIIAAVGYRVTRVRITELVSSTYYSRIHLAPVGGGEEVDLDARPSDAINLAVRFNAPMYISKRIAENATAYPSEAMTLQGGESHAEIVRSVRETLASFEDPTTMLQLQKELAIQEERYGDAQAFQQEIYKQMTHSVMLRLVVAMEAALADGRYEEAARVRDEYKRLIGSATPDSATKKL